MMLLQPCEHRNLHSFFFPVHILHRSPVDLYDERKFPLHAVMKVEYKLCAYIIKFA